MAPVTNPRVLFNQIPKDYPVPGKTTIYDTTQQLDLDAPLNGGVLIKVLVLSIDPYMRGRMREPDQSGSGGNNSYLGPFIIGSPLENYGVGIVLRSENPAFKKGDNVYGHLEFQAYTIKTNVSGLTIFENKENLPWSVYVGVAGMPGQTAYVGWKLFSKAKQGETVFVTSAGGPVGATVIQLAKADGLKVIASAGSDEKVAFAKEAGADVAFNYKTKNTMTALQELGHGIDIFWDNVGGKEPFPWDDNCLSLTYTYAKAETLDTALVALNFFGRVINCGYISSYNATEHYGIKALRLIIPKRISLNGFIVSDHEDMIKEFYSVFPKMISSGQIKHREDVYTGLERAGQAILDVQKGNNKAKAVINIPEA